ncbi:MAG TPA: hypothetical protein VLV16_04285 [Gemmatimonadales bacterium]|nr:hypothetical protein [Gemmatimonadales bacterium]
MRTWHVSSLVLLPLLLASAVSATGLLSIEGAASNNNATTGNDFANSAAIGPIIDSAQTLNGAPPGTGSEIETVFASANYGILGVSAGGQVVGPVSVSALGASGNAFASFSDNLTIMAPGLAGMIGSVRVVFGLASFVSVDGGVGSGCSGSAQVSYGVVASLSGGGGSGSSNQSGTWTDYPCFNTHTFSGTPPGIFSLTAPVLFGSPAQLSVNLSALSNESWLDFASGSATAEGDFAHTLTWGGFTEVRDAQGNLVTNYSVTSDSGTDWSKPAPEPATAVLVATGLIALGASRPVRANRRNAQTPHWK